MLVFLIMMLLVISGQCGESDIVRCYGVVSSKKASNSSQLNHGRNGKGVPCDPNGFVFLLRHDCARLMRGTYQNKTQRSCVDRPCRTKVDRCTVASKDVSRAIVRALAKMNSAPPKESKNIFQPPKPPGTVVSY